MKNSFNTQEYIRLLGEELILEFSKAGMTTHPHAVGGGRESSARTKLKNILPAGIGVGSGFVIDSYGNTSQQCDIILYEENFAMKFTINDDQANTYYNCESVIAVGEIKSTAKLSEVKDAIDKLSKVKQLKRHNDNGHDYRKYLLAATICDSLDDITIEYNSGDNTFKQIFTFLLCQKLDTKTNSIIDYMKKSCNKECEYINKILSTDGAYISFLDISKNPAVNMPGRIGANAVFNLVDNPYTFNYFIHDLVEFILLATTVPLNYGRYLALPIQVSDLKEIILL